MESKRNPGAAAGDRRFEPPGPIAGAGRAGEAAKSPALDRWRTSLFLGDARPPWISESRRGPQALKRLLQRRGMVD